MSEKNFFELGTAQFGMDYGIANSKGQTPKNEVRSMLSMALSIGVKSLDTAALYTHSQSGISAEEILGGILSDPQMPEYVVNTKFSLKTFRETRDHSLEKFVNEVQTHFHKAQKNLGNGTKLGLFYFHHFDDFEFFSNTLSKVDKEHWASLGIKLGVSLYDDHELKFCQDFLREKPGVIQGLQLPLNILECDSEKIETIKQIQRSFKCEIHLRSLYLQGLLLMNEDNLKHKSLRLYEVFSPVLRKLKSLSKDLKIKTEELCLGGVNAMVSDCHFVIGCNDQAQLMDNVRSFSVQLHDEVLNELRSLPHEVVDKKMLLPKNW